MFTSTETKCEVDLAHFYNSVLSWLLTGLDYVTSDERSGSIAATDVAINCLIQNCCNKYISEYT